ncbi:exosortase system-associated protein, TIGR04073 family [Akkermansia glycaniphila]|uniref:exosortase system-associated protein, TIGR04073 family n=1 Tax=Akkermansia glycaniphila TaxID=1679444 RepID=UPI001C016910|nr:exosortase system-associated protein, TIGR04073 family [Akkermansia glycaniphila]MBT9450335.1 exosortase system-associated protein, TIGR04073 family [Akkermansia glycaniphila]
MKRAVLSALVLFGLAGTCYADIQAPPASEYTATRKLGRAISNLIYAVEEVPTSILRWQDMDGNYAGWSVGVVDGFARTFERMGYGFYELVTFWAPTYKCTYRPPYQGSCGRNGLKEYNPWSGFTEFPQELGFQSYYNYSRQQQY